LGFAYIIMATCLLPRKGKSDKILPFISRNGGFASAAPAPAPNHSAEFSSKTFCSAEYSARPTQPG
jgi:hypothetical protein